MKLNEAKQASSDAIKRSRRNGDDVEKIMREAEEVEGGVKKMIQRFTQRIKLYRAKLAERANEAAVNGEGGE